MESEGDAFLGIVFFILPPLAFFFFFSFSSLHLHLYFSPRSTALALFLPLTPFVPPFHFLLFSLVPFPLPSPITPQLSSYSLSLSPFPSTYPSSLHPPPPLSPFLRPHFPLVHPPLSSPSSPRLSLSFLLHPPPPPMTSPTPLPTSPPPQEFAGAFTNILAAVARSLLENLSRK